MLPMLALSPCDTMGSTSTSLQSVRKPSAELKGTALLWDCVDITGDTTNAKGCIFCGYKFPGGPSRIGDHLLASKGKHVKPCKPDLMQPRYKEVVAELRRRAQNAQQESNVCRHTCRVAVKWLQAEGSSHGVAFIGLQSYGCSHGVPVRGLPFTLTLTLPSPSHSHPHPTCNPHPHCNPLTATL